MSQPATSKSTLLRMLLLDFDPNLRQLLQLSFTLAASMVFFLSTLPDLRDRFLIYGSRAVPADAAEKTDEIQESRQSARWYMRILEDIVKDKTKDAKRRSSWSNKCLHFLEDLRVPHDWFLHFYVASVACSIFWGVKIARKTVLVVKICENVRPGGTMSINQIALVWLLMALQGVRRLAESIILGKSSSSKMWFVHWLLGIWFYVAMSFAVWVEGAETILQSQSPLREISFSVPSVRTMLSIPLSIIASGIQHDCHAYLASLPKYTLPNHPIFHTMVCPHYTAECVIYLSLAVLGAPQGAWVNKTILTAFVFVAVNLGATASITKDWYIKKFGKEKVAYRWKMIPYIF